ncbi:Serine/threonine-protein kinase PknB [Aquisphaera giovannonii]|uniref:non-specific serine/threonine protein kinase n=2 Tax=Aquisphaera giovannonii TaxID=406548 RepID=A0A5B9WAW2_9BACT|nr:Serine/threonine-protein kinase PknB [Aquisphaera giovannonii]
MGWGDDPAEAPVRDLTGVTLGDFQIQRMLGRGGMGEVYLATQVSLSRPVALKVLHRRYLSNPTYLSRFEAEAAAVAKLNHPNIVHVYMQGSVDRVRFIAMEYVDGTNLRDYLSKKGALDLPLAVSIMRQAGMAIGAAGEVGLVHRDIKPENILLTKKGRVKVADFGLCRDLEADRMHVTQPGTTMGTPLYMSPEQAQGKHLDHRSDLYSLGVTFYHMLTGEPPFRAESAVALAMKHVTEQPIGLRLRREEIPVELERLVLKLMAKSPGDRYQSAAEMLADLARIRGQIMGSAQVTGAELSVASPSLSKGEDPPISISGVKALAAVGPASPRRDGIGDRLARPAVLAALAAAGLVAGAASAWMARPTIRFADAKPGTAAPGLRLETAWAGVPRQESAEAQFRYALLRAPMLELPAAWAAVPGYHPKPSEWVSSAYLHLARRYFREGDVRRLNTLRDELAAWAAARTEDRELVELLGPALKLLTGDLDGVIAGMSGLTFAVDRPAAQGREELRLFDPGLLEFGAEIASRAIKLTGQAGESAGQIKRDKLVGIQRRLMVSLRRVRELEWRRQSGPV